MPKPATKKIADGMHTVTPHIIVNGAVDAIEFYKKAFDATEVMRMPTPTGKLMHAAINIGDSRVMLVDENADWNIRGPKLLGGTPVTIHLSVEDVDTVYAQAVAAGATAIMPVADQFWGDRYGIVQDPYGHHWSIATHVFDLTPEELQANMLKVCGG